MVKYNGSWGAVCDDNFDSTDAASACYTLGYSGGAYSSFNTGWSESAIPFWMDNMGCSSGSTNFFDCSFAGWGNEDCGSSEYVLLTCT